ncbi:hypothetical protein LEP3755_18750 [Leptolyngbya sp. NIES-3755]|nr:hypothetical protein LEP3755_18750 [Leptolyngbya sp. NIES-3755]
MPHYSFKNQLLYVLSPVLLIALTSCGGSQSTSTPSASVQPSIAPSPTNPIVSSPTVSSPTAAPSVAASPTVDSSRAVSLENGRVTFTLPEGFTPMTTEEINLKFPPRGGNRPQYVYANADRNVAIAVTFSPAKVTPQQLPELQQVIRKSVGQAFPTAEWKTEEMTTINNTPWAHLAFISQAIDTKIYNDAYFTSLDGKMLGINFNSTVAQYEANRAELQKTRDSIVIKPL